MLDKLLKEYAERFNEAFPIFMAPPEEDEIIKIIEKSLETNTRYKPKYKKDVLYSTIEY